MICPQNKTRRIFFLILTLIILSVITCGIVFSKPSYVDLRGLHGSFVIAKVIDGDTLVLNNGERIRLIGVDAPEITYADSKANEPGLKSTSAMIKIAQGLECTLEYEAEDLRDKYGRLLAYVFVGDKMLNADIIRQGYAYAYTKFAFSRKDELLILEEQARKEKKGFWGMSAEELGISSQIISWQEADQYYNQFVTVKGIIVNTYNTGKICFLNFHPDYKNYFTAVIFSSDFSRFPRNPENYFKGKQVFITGYVKKYKGKPEIEIKYPFQIEVS